MRLVAVGWPKTVSALMEPQLFVFGSRLWVVKHSSVVGILVEPTSHALRHGILSAEVLILAGEGSEDANLFDEFSQTLRQDLVPVGTLEELLVDTLIMLTWRWRRALKYEMATIRQDSDMSTENWEKEQLRAWQRYGILMKEDRWVYGRTGCFSQDHKGVPECIEGTGPAGSLSQPLLQSIL